MRQAERLLVNVQGALDQPPVPRVVAFVVIEHPQLVEQVSDVDVLRPQLLLAQLQRTLDERQRLVVLGDGAQAECSRAQPVRLVERAVVLVGRAQLRQANLVAPRRAPDLPLDFKPVDARRLGDEVGALLAPRPDLGVELREQLPAGREHLLDYVNAVLPHGDADELPRGGDDLEALPLAARNLSLAGAARRERAAAPCVEWRGDD